MFYKVLPFGEDLGGAFPFEEDLGGAFLFGEI